MCRNIKILFNFDPPATDEEIRAASLQFIRKVSGTTKPSIANEAAFEQAVCDVAESVSHLLSRMVTSTPPKDREQEKAKVIARNQRRFGKVDRVAE